MAKEQVLIFNAGSLNLPFEQMEKTFEARHPGIDIVRESGGSTKLARMISESGKKPDIMASADYTVIDKTLIPEYAAWDVRFASNQLVLCFTDQSEFSSEINADNWMDILERKKVAWGHSDPNLDPCGYRSLMVLQLAEKYYDKPGLYERLIANRPQANVLPKAVQLVAMLKDGRLDYGWEYLSVAVQHHLRYVQLPDKINLGNYKFNDYYRQAKVEVTGKSPGTFITRTGKSCTYGITLLNSAPNKSGAILFLEYLLAPEGGLKVLQQMGQPPFMPAWVPGKQMHNRLPKPLQPLVEARQ